MMRKPHVYVATMNDYDLSPAAVYGEIVVMYHNRPRAVFNTSNHAYHLREELKDAQSSDYLLLAGNQVIVLLMFGILLERFGFVNLLLYDIRTREYIPRVVPRHHLQYIRKE